MYNVQCTMYSVQCTVYNVQCTMYSVQCTVYNVQCTMYSVQCTVYNVQCTMYSVQCTVYNVQCTMYSVQCTMYNVQCTWLTAINIAFHIIRSFSKATSDLLLSVSKMEESIKRLKKAKPTASHIQVLRVNNTLYPLALISFADTAV